MFLKDILSVLLGLMGVFFTLLMFFSRNTVKTAYYLVMVFIAFSGFYFLLGAYFLGFVQLIVYAGAIMVMVLFTLNYFSAQQEIQRGEIRPLRRYFAYLLALICTVLLIGVFSTFVADKSPEDAKAIARITEQAELKEVTAVQAAITDDEQVTRLSKRLFSKYLLPFELTSVIILLAMVGAIYLTWHRRDAVGDLPAGEEGS